MENIKNIFEILVNTNSNINEHLNTLCEYAKKCDSVFETGFRGYVSSWALLYGLLQSSSTNPKRLFVNDITICNIYSLIEETKHLDIDITYEWKNNLLLEMKNNYDLTFIDTWHVYGQLKRELEKFSKITNKYIIMHDTTVDEIHGESIRLGLDVITQSKESGFPIEEITKGLRPAIEEFLQNNPEWYMAERFTNNNGLTILAKYN
jgi:hypothetical protein